MIWKLRWYFRNKRHLSVFLGTLMNFNEKFKKMVDKWHKEIGWSFCTPLSLYSLCMQSSISHTHFGNACVWFSHSSWSRWRIFLASLQKWSLGFSFECCCHKEAKINLRSCQKDLGQKMTPVKVRDVLIKSWLLSSENSPQ